MLPLGHFAVAYLLYSVGCRVLARRVPTAREVVLVGFASQFPDLVDKPLAAVGVLPTGRSLAHSFLTLGFLSVGLAVVARRLDRRFVAAAFTVGSVSHSLADAAPGLITGRVTPVGGGFLLWPFAFDGPTYSLLWVPGAAFFRRLLSARPESTVLVVLAGVFLWYDLVITNEREDDPPVRENG